MSEMSDWIASLTGGGEVGGRPVTQAPVEPAPVTQAPVEPGAPAAAAPINPLLRDYLLQRQSGHNVLSDEMYNYFGGDNILAALRAYDPNASVEQVGMGDEAGNMGRRFNFDVRSLPSVTLPNGQTVAGNDSLLQLKPMYDDRSLYHNPDMFYDDPVYGRITPGKNQKEQAKTWMDYAGPLAVGLVAPWAAGALAGAGIGGAAGLTGAVTGSGVAAGAGAAPWWASTLGKAPQIARSTFGGGGFNPAGLASAALGAGANYFGIPSEFASAAGSFAGSLGGGGGGSRSPQPPKSTYNPQAMANQGSPKKTNSGSSLVANQFAPGAYNNSWGFNG